MTLLLASLVGAALFFAAGVAAAMLRRGPRIELAAPVPVITELVDVVTDPEKRAHHEAEMLRGELERLRRELGDALRKRAPATDNAVAKAELGRARAAVEIAERSALQARTELDLERAAAIAARTELARVRSELEQAAAPDNELARLRSTVAASESKLEQLTRKLRDEQRSVAQLSAELEQARTANRRLQVTTTQSARVDASFSQAFELQRTEQLSQQLVESQRTSSELAVELEQARNTIAGNTATLRDLSAENEQLRGKVNDAEALRADYVRLKTSMTETAFLKHEIVRLEEQVRTLRREALGGHGRRQPRASSRLLPAGSIAASLAAALEKFAEPATRSSAVADPQGFPLASAGDDGQALAAYAALAIDIGDRASQLLPVGKPSTIEIVDDRGARVAVWTFEVERERLVLANLSVAPVAAIRVETALADLGVILATGRTA